jgi:small conductance mechanosensitive channel
MNDHPEAWGLLRKLTWDDALLAVAVLVAAQVLVSVIQWVLRHLAEKASPHLRLGILRTVPIARLLVRIGAIVLVVSILVEPTFRNVAGLLASIGLVLAFALKDYGSCLVAGVVTVLENVYQPGDWIEVDGAYGEVTSIGIRAVSIVTLDDTEVIIPHSRLWSAGIFNASSGNRSLLCVADFYLHPDHDAFDARRRLTETAIMSSFRKPETPVTVIVQEKPWGTHYRVKGYVKESREQALFTTDLTIRGKEALRAANVRFAESPYAATGGD